MADIIMGAQDKDQGSGSWISSLLPVAALAVIGFLGWLLLTNQTGTGGQQYSGSAQQNGNQAGGGNSGAQQTPNSLYYSLTGGSGAGTGGASGNQGSNGNPTKTPTPNPSQGLPAPQAIIGGATYSPGPTVGGKPSQWIYTAGPSGNPVNTGLLATILGPVYSPAPTQQNNPAAVAQSVAQPAPAAGNPLGSLVAGISALPLSPVAGAALIGNAAIEAGASAWGDLTNIFQGANTQGLNW